MEVSPHTGIPEQGKDQKGRNTNGKMLDGHEVPVYSLSTGPRLTATYQLWGSRQPGLVTARITWAEVGDLEWLSPPIEGPEASRQKCEKTRKEEKPVPDWKSENQFKWRKKKKILKLFRLGRKPVTKLNGNLISPKVLKQL